MQKELKALLDIAEQAYLQNPCPETYAEYYRVGQQYELGYMLFSSTDRWLEDPQHKVAIQEE